MNTKEKKEKTEVSRKKKASSLGLSEAFLKKRREEHYGILKNRATRECDFPDYSSLRAGPYEDNTEISDEFISDGVLMLTVYNGASVITPPEYCLEGNTLYYPGKFRLRPLPYLKKEGWLRMYRTLYLKTLNESIEGFSYNERILVPVSEEFSFRMKVHFVIRLKDGGTIYVNIYRPENERYSFRRRLFFEFKRRNILRIKPERLEKIINEYDRKKRKDGTLPDDKHFVPGLTK